MRTALLAFMGIAATTMIAMSALGRGVNDRDTVRPPIKAVFLRNLEQKSERVSILSGTTKRKVAAVQAEIAADPLFARKLLARGIKVKNVIRLDEVPNKWTIVYVR